MKKEINYRVFYQPEALVSIAYVFFFFFFFSPSVSRPSWASLSLVLFLVVLSDHGCPQHALWMIKALKKAKRRNKTLSLKLQFVPSDSRLTLWVRQWESFSLPTAHSEGRRKTARWLSFKSQQPRHKSPGVLRLLWNYTGHVSDFLISHRV